MAAHKDMEWINAISYFCMQPSGRQVCRSVVYIMFGPSPFYFDELLHTIMNHIPAGASYRQLVHYAQIAAARKYQPRLYSRLKIELNWFLISQPDFFFLREIPALPLW